MADFLPINRQHLLNVIAKFPPEIVRNDTQRVFWLSIAIIKHFLGLDWANQHVSPETPEPGFLRVIPGATAKTQMSTFRVVDFAELLWNLQRVPGFETCIDRMKRGNIEATYAELDFGRMLYSAGAVFRFIKPQLKKGRDYDIEIVLPDGMIVCADAKCKVEVRDFSGETIRNSLEGARKQLPKDRPSAIFVKVPFRWFEKIENATELLEIARRFLRGTGRVVSVKFYSAHVAYRDGMLTQSLGFKEISNPNNRFEPGRNWDMFADPNPTSSWNGMPVNWKRLLFFPNDGPS